MFWSAIDLQNYGRNKEIKHSHNTRKNSKELQMVSQEMEYRLTGSF